MNYVVSNGYYVLNVNGKNYVVDKASRCSFVLHKSDKIRLNGQTFSPRFERGKRYFDTMIGMPVDGFLCRDILDAVGGIELHNAAVAIGQPSLAA